MDSLRLTLLLFSLCGYLTLQVASVELDEFDDDDYDDDFSSVFHKHDYWSMDTEERVEKDEEIFFFFEHHDANDDKLLDGTELLQAMYHEETADLPADHHDHPHAAKLDKWRMSRMAALVDKSISNFDYDDNGYFSWPEFFKAAIHYNLVKE